MLAEANWVCWSVGSMQTSIPIFYNNSTWIEPVVFSYRRFKYSTYMLLISFVIVWFLLRSTACGYRVCACVFCAFLVWASEPIRFVATEKHPNSEIVNKQPLCDDDELANNKIIQFQKFILLFTLFSPLLHPPICLSRPQLYVYAYQFPTKTTNNEERINLRSIRIVTTKYGNYARVYCARLHTLTFVKSGKNAIETKPL